ncbi:MAG TPA: hypothetical protein VGQ20_05330 [Acidimicrobiales bacterium]|nr:hypothetical protein [Acidimicrobiales bacterium]
MDAPETVTEAIRLLERDGYRSDFSIDTLTVRCAECDHAHEAVQLRVLRTFRFEGVTDPADEAIVLGVECAACGVRGIVVSAYGPDADPQLIALLDRLAT